MRLEKNRQDQMTPAERITSAGEGKMVDRVITIPFMGELKCYLSGISIDSSVDIAYAKETVGDKLSIMGNVSPMEILNGTPESIEQAVIDCFRKCWDNPRGFTIAPGCDIPVTTSLENIDAYMRAARKCAKYPVQPSNWE